MSINYQLIPEEQTITAVLRNIEIPENVKTVGYAPSLIQKGTEQKLKFDTCIISTISDVFHKTSPNVTQIEVKNSIIDRIDLRILKKFTKLEEFSVVNSTLNEFAGTIFEILRDLTLKFEKDEEDDDGVSVVFDGKISLGYLEDKEDDVQDQSPGSNGVNPLLSSPINSNPVQRPILTAKSFCRSQSPKTAFPIVTLGSTSPSVVQSYGIYHPPLQTSIGQPSSSFGSSSFVSIFGPPTATDQSSAAKRSCDAQGDSKIPKNLDFRANLKEKYTKSQTINANLSKDLDVLREQIMKLEAENKKLKESGILADLKKIFHDEAFKDFTVNVNKEKSFKIHKILFAARSSVIADMIRNNPEDFELNLQDIPLPIFEILLHFIYNDSAPDVDDNLIATYAAAGRLNIVDLKNLTAQKLMDKVDEKNSLRILELSNKYGNDELRLKAFEEIKKVLSDYKLNDEFSKKPEKVKKLLDIKKTMDEEYAKMQKEIEEAQVIADDQQEVAEAGSDTYEIVD